MAHGLTVSRGAGRHRTQLSTKTKTLTSTCTWTLSGLFSANEHFLVCPLLWPNLHLFLMTCSSSSMGLRTYLKRSLRARFHSNCMGKKYYVTTSIFLRFAPFLKQVTLFYLILLHKKEFATKQKKTL